MKENVLIGAIVTVKFETIGSTVPTDTSVPHQHSLIDALPQR